jgi:hypothetical protein
MTSIYTAILTLSIIICYIILTDKNVEDYLILSFKIIKINTERMFWMIRLHPRNPITNLMMKWKYEKLARELQAEMECKATELNNNSKIIE